MISRMRRLLGSASFEELGWFWTKSVLLVGTLALIGLPALEVVPAFFQSEPGFDKAYIADAIYLLGLLSFVVAIFLLAATNYRLLQDTITRCELAEDEMAWINQHPDYEKMIEDRELMRLAANVRRVCRTYPATHGLLANFLEQYRAVLNRYGSAVEEKRSALIEEMNEAAEEGLERYQLRTRREREREQMNKDREGS